MQILKKNTIEQQADDFMKYAIKNSYDYLGFTESCSKAILNYKKNIHCILFLERLHLLVRENYDRHLVFCNTISSDHCRFNKFHKVVLFYLQDEISSKEKSLPLSYFKRHERQYIDQNIKEMLYLLKNLKYTDLNKYLNFKLELFEMCEYYFLNKKDWKQLFLDKVIVMLENNIITPDEMSKIVTKINTISLSKSIIRQYDKVYSLKS